MPVRDAYTPVIKLRLGETDVDLLFVSLATATVPEPLDVLDDALLAGLDEPAIRSLNGARVAELLLRLVPDQNTFRVALRAIKKWAREKGLYSNVLGLFGGVNCAILVAFVCQRYPRATSALIVGRFFRVFDEWHFPYPIILKAPDSPATHHTRKNGGAAVFQSPAASYTAWNPVLNPRDRGHIAPIITPAHPAMNSSYNIGEPQLRAIKAELKCGVATTKAIEALAFAHRATLLAASTTSLAATATATATAPPPRRILIPAEGGHGAGEVAAQLEQAWLRLFAPSDFFDAHQHYIRIDISARDDDDLRRWFAWCESRLRGLVLSLDNPPHMIARPHATPVDRTEPSTGRKLRSIYVGLAFQHTVNEVDITPNVQEFSGRVDGWVHRLPGMDCKLHHHSRADIMRSLQPPLRTTTVETAAGDGNAPDPAAGLESNGAAPPPAADPSASSSSEPRASAVADGAPSSTRDDGEDDEASTQQAAPSPTVDDADRLPAVEPPTGMADAGPTAAAATTTMTTTTTAPTADLSGGSPSSSSSSSSSSSPPTPNGGGPSAAAAAAAAPDSDHHQQAQTRERSDSATPGVASPSSPLKKHRGLEKPEDATTKEASQRRSRSSTEDSESAPPPADRSRGPKSYAQALLAAAPRQPPRSLSPRS